MSIALAVACQNGGEQNIFFKFNLYVKGSRKNSDMWFVISFELVVKNIISLCQFFLSASYLSRSGEMLRGFPPDFWKDVSHNSHEQTMQGNSSDISIK